MKASFEQTWPRRWSNLHATTKAQPEVRRAIDCKSPLGHAAEPWKTWWVVANLEHATGHTDTALAARQRTIQTYTAYRRDGGVSLNCRAGAFDMVAKAIRRGDPQAALLCLNQFAARPDVTAFVTAYRRQTRLHFGRQPQPCPGRRSRT